MTAGYYAVTGVCPTRKVTVLDVKSTPTRGMPYWCACGHEHDIMTFTRWGWWLRCFAQGCGIHIVYRESNTAVRRALIHDHTHHPHIIVYEGTKFERYSAIIYVNQSTLGSDDA